MRNERTTFCPVCQNGEQGYCDELCDRREPNGQPGHFPGQTSVVMHNAPNLDVAFLEAERVMVWRRFDRSMGR